MSWFKPTRKFTEGFSVGAPTFTPDPRATPACGFKDREGKFHDTEAAAIEASRRIEHSEAYKKATTDLDTIAHLGGSFDRYESRRGEDAKYLVIHQILTHRDRVLAILNSIPN